METVRVFNPPLPRENRNKLMIVLFAVSDSSELLKEKFSTPRNLHLQLAIFVLLVSKSLDKVLKGVVGWPTSYNSPCSPPSHKPDV